MKISEVFEEYINNYMILRGYSPNQILGYKVARELLIGWVKDKPIAELSLTEICEWGLAVKSYRHLCQNTQGLYMTRIRQILKYAKSLGEDCVDWSMVPVPKRIPTAPAYLTAKEVQRMIDVCQTPRTKLVISLLYSSGLRLSEFCALNRGDICDGQFTVLGKGKKLRIGFVDQRSRALLKAYLKERHDNELPLILTRFGDRISATAVQGIVRRAARRAGIFDRKVTPHTLRHSFATNFLENNGNIRHLQDLLGHANLGTTQIYTHVSNNSLKSAYMAHHSC